MLARESVSQAGSDLVGLLSAAKETTHGDIEIIMEINILLAKFKFIAFIIWSLIFILLYGGSHQN
jgi:hypothetical protein